MKYSIMVFRVIVLVCFCIATTDYLFASNGQDAITARITVPNYEITTTSLGQELAVDDFGYLMIPGKPKLPSRIFAIAIPPGTEVANIDFILGEGLVLSGNYRIAPVPLPRVIGDEDPAIYEQERQIYDENYNSVYGSDAIYPKNNVEFVRNAGYRKYNLVDIQVTPFSYRPISGELVYYPDITVDVEYKSSDRLDTPVVDDLERTERIAEEIIVNYDQARNWYPRDMILDEDYHNFVIITIETLASSISPLVDWETQKGRNVEVVTTSWINDNYTGYDLAEKIRNFLRDKYPSSEWGIEDVLIIGHYDSVPMRRTYLDLGYGQPETDYYYAELSLPDDQSWDENGNGLYGEETDFNDFYTEVNVGRIPWSDANTVRSICEKSVAYEQNNDRSFKKNILLLGGFFWDDDPNPRTDCAVLMEAIVDQPWMDEWTMTRMYELGYSNYPMDYDLWNSNVRSELSTGTYAIVSYAGHGSPTSSHRYHNGMPAFISSSDSYYLDDNYPAIMFADACSNSDTDYLNIGQAMLRRGSVGFLGATKVARGCPAWDDPMDGSSQSLNYFFTTALTSGEYTLGQAHQRALRIMYQYGLWINVKYETFEWGAIWGNPDLSMAPASQRALSILFPDGLPEYVEPGEETSFIVRIEGGGESYLPGTGDLYYRFDDGSFSSADLIPLENDLFIATLPASDCEAIPQFYISAMGDQGTQVVNPADSPDSYYSSNVGELLEIMNDEFEFDQGWLTDGDAIAGHWDRGMPFGGGERGDPPTDYDGSGQCYLTGNERGDSDIDGGYVFLTSPRINLTNAEHAIIRYALWYTNYFGDTPSQDLFKTYISNNDGDTWRLTETIGPGTAGGWFEHTINVTDFVEPTSLVRVMFEASDLGGGSVVEAGIDEFKVDRLICQPTLADDKPENLPGDFALLGSYPNPFNARAIIRYALPQVSDVTIEIYDLLGRRVETLVDGQKQAGYHHVTWNADNFSSGVYFYRIQAADFSDTRRMLLLK
ncbi:MAG: C25 family cysteine peptidase [candidate division Zixibacteria bacterium]